MSRSPIFPIPEPHHFSDYGFDPQIGYFQVLEEARRHGRRGESRASAAALDSLHLKLQKPISKEERGRPKKQQQQQQRHRRRWWRNAGSALFFWKRPPKSSAANDEAGEPRGRYPYRAVSGPLYVADHGAAAAAAATTCRASRPSSGPLAAAEVGALGIPYLSLRDLNLVDGGVGGGAAPPPLPIYLVT